MTYPDAIGRTSTHMEA